MPGVGLARLAVGCFGGLQFHPFGVRFHWKILRGLLVVVLVIFDLTIDYTIGSFVELDQ